MDYVRSNKHKQSQNIYFVFYKIKTIYQLVCSRTSDSLLTTPVDTNVFNETDDYNVARIQKYIYSDISIFKNNDTYKKQNLTAPRAGHGNRAV